MKILESNKTTTTTTIIFRTYYSFIIIEIPRFDHVRNKKKDTK